MTRSTIQFRNMTIQYVFLLPLNQDTDFYLINTI
jgi:hypothetical protein